MQSRISDSQDSVTSSKREIDNAINQLEKLLVKESNSINRYEDKIAEVVNDAKM